MPGYANPQPGYPGQPYNPNMGMGMPTYTPPAYHPGQPMMPPPHPQTSTMNTVVITGGNRGPQQPNVMLANTIQVWPTHSVFIKCLACQKSGYTRITRSLRPLALLFAIFLFFIICLFAFVIFCVDASYCTEHHCVHCDTHLGSSA